VLYLENNLASHVFTPTRISVLELLASQAAISLENARLYNDLEEREAKLRHLVDANIIGVFIWDFDGRILEANDAFLHIVGYDREDLIASRINWMDLTPPEWRDADARLIEERRLIRHLPPFEKEYFRKDGSRVPVLIGVATFEEGVNQGVAFVLDLTERKRAEGALRDAQANLAHVVRVTTLGELTASISHEVNQPLAAVVNAGAACLRWLDREIPDLDEARRAVDWIIKEGNRASEVIRRVRALANKTSIERVPLDINDVVREVIALVQRELISHGVSLQMEFAPALL
jgi:PAS domain S-box-containing protein